MKKKLAPLFLCVTLCLMGCMGEEPAEQTEIVLLHGWGTMESDHQAMRQIYQDFEKENPDVKLNLVSMPSSQRVIAKAQDMLAVGNTPDLIFAGGEGKDTLYSYMTSEGYAVDLMPYMEKDPEFKSMISPATLERWKTSDGKLFTVSDVLLESGYWYNKKIFENAGISKVPSTWEEFVECCRLIREWADREKLNTLPLHLDPETCLYLVNAYMAGQKPSADYPLGGDEELFREALKQLKELQQYASEEDRSFTYRDKMRSFSLGHCAICVNGVWSEQMLHPNLEAGYAALPSKDGMSVGMISSCIGYLMGKSGDDLQQKACIRFLKYMLSEPIQQRILKETGQIPSNPNITGEISRQHEKLYEACQAVEGADIVREIPANIWNDKQMRLFQEHIGDYLQEKTDLDDFIQSIKN